MKTRRTTDAVAILHDRFVRGKPGAKEILNEEREKLRLAIERAAQPRKDLKNRSDS